MAGINDKTFFGDDVTLVGSGAGAQDVIQITPDTAIGGVAWKGIDISGGTLDPTAVSATITGMDIDLSGVSLANDPIMNALHVQMPASFSGSEEKHCVLLEGFGSTIKICDGDDGTAISADGEIHVDFDATALTAGEVVTVYDAVVAQGAATDGHVHAFDVTTVGSGSVDVIAVSTHPNVEVIHQHIGTSGAIDQGWIELGAGGFTDSTAAFNAAGTDLPIFVNNTDLIYIGMTAAFDHLDVVLDTLSSKDLRPDFAYSTGAGFSAFIPSDETNGFQQSGAIFWDSSSLAGFAARVVNGSAALFFIRITRDRAGALTNPIEDTIQALAATEFKWDSAGDVEINSALVGISNTGATNTIKLQNPSDTASSSSQSEISVGGTSAGDPWAQWTVGTTQSYALGIDNSDSDKFKLTTDGDATVDPSSGTEIFAYTISGDLFDFETTRLSVTSDPGNVPVVLGCANQNAGAAADAFVDINCQTGTGDSHIRYITDGGSWHSGNDTGDSSTYHIKIGSSELFDQTTVQKITQAGEVTFPLTPAFLATHVAASNVTGAGTAYTYGSAGGAGMTEIFDQNSDFNPGDGAGADATFTSPVTGRYMLGISFRLSQLTAAMTTGVLTIVTSNRSYQVLSANYGAMRAGTGLPNALDYSASVLADMDASDTATFKVQVLNGAGDDADLGAGETRVWGNLEC